MTRCGNAFTAPRGAWNPGLGRRPTSQVKLPVATLGTTIAINAGHARRPCHTTRAAMATWYAASEATLNDAMAAEASELRMPLPNPYMTVA